MEIRNLSTFIKVVEEQSLSKAAKQLGYAQSTVTMQMQQLEQELGTPLYERVGKQIRITQEGQELFQYAVRIVRTSQEALQIGREKGQPAGDLRLGFGDMMGEDQIAELLHLYTNRYPDVRVSVRIADGRSLVPMLLHNEIDLLTTVDHRLTDPVLVHACDSEEVFHFAAASNHPLSGEQKLNLSDILRYRLIRGDLSSAAEQDLEAAMDAEKSAETGQMSVGGQMEMGSWNLALRMVRYGDAVALAPDSALTKTDGSVVRLNYNLPGAGLLRQTVYHKNKWLTGAMNAWIKMLEDT